MIASYWWILNSKDTELRQSSQQKNNHMSKVLLVWIMVMFMLSSAGRAELPRLFKTHLMQWYQRAMNTRIKLLTYVSLKTIVLEPVIPMTRKSMLKSSFRTAACQSKTEISKLVQLPTTKAHFASKFENRFHIFVSSCYISRKDTNMATRLMNPMLA